jgi:hypothetical protein
LFIKRKKVEREKRRGTMAPTGVVSGAHALDHPHTLAERRIFSMGGDRSTSSDISGSALGEPLPHVSSTLMESTMRISNVVTELKQRMSSELVSARSDEFDMTYDRIRDKIAAQRISHLPPEQSGYDKVLDWIQLFVERLHSFDMAIQQFAGDSNLAAKLAYGCCARLLKARRYSCA